MIEYILFVLGIVFLVKGANFLVKGSTSLAKKLGISSLITGLTIVAFGTSMPELIVSLISAFKGTSEIVFGNIIGSNISNILLVLGATAIIRNVKIKKTTVWKEIPFALLAVIVLFILSNKIFLGGSSPSMLGRIDGLILLLFFVIFIYYAFAIVKPSKKDNKSKEKTPYWKIFSMITLGIVGLYLGGKWAVEGAIFIAENLGLSQFLISATIIAIGTSLPELVTSIVAVLKRNVDLAVGNIIGSNIFNIFWILGITSLIKPILIPSFINFDLIILAFITLLLFSLMFIKKRQVLGRKQGILFILLYATYLVFLIIRG